jgi:Flp pilus assembly protein TadB
MTTSNGAGWTLDTLQEHHTVVNALKKEFEIERDRRYSEVNIEREKALKIKEEADKAALGLAREIQIYKDEKANQLREQINSERGLYATKADLISAQRELTASIAPLSIYIQGQAGENKKGETSRVTTVAIVSIAYSLVATVGIIITVVTLLLRS